MTRHQINALNPTGIIVHGLHKSGTMFLYQLCFRLSRARRIKYYSPNLERPNDHLINADFDHDFCLCPVRNFAEEPAGLDNRYRLSRIFHVRDPRDILVSQYYSYGWSHSEQDFESQRQIQREKIQSLSIDEYVLQERGVVRPLKKKFADLIHRQPYELGNVVRYEQMVLNFPAWLDKVVRHFNFRNPAMIKARTVFRYRNEFQPDPAPGSHKRNVMPGDHLSKLRPQTIKRLNEIFEPELRALKYAFDGSLAKVA